MTVGFFGFSSSTANGQTIASQSRDLLSTNQNVAEMTSLHAPLSDALWARCAKMVKVRYVLIYHSMRISEKVLNFPTYHRATG